MINNKTITETVKEIIQNEQQKQFLNKSLQNFQDFYRDMQKQGLILKQEYNLPLFDTIGRYAFEKK